jgi:hypothetical protein
MGFVKVSGKPKSDNLRNLQNLAKKTDSIFHKKSRSFQSGFSASKTGNREDQAARAA